MISWARVQQNEVCHSATSKKQLKWFWNISTFTKHLREHIFFLEVITDIQALHQATGLLCLRSLQGTTDLIRFAVIGWLQPSLKSHFNSLIHNNFNKYIQLLPCFLTDLVLLEKGSGAMSFHPGCISPPYSWW